MTIPADLAKRPLIERLQAMEILWDSLSQDKNYEPSPNWHKALLNGRIEELDGCIEELEQGSHSDWSQAKERIRARILPAISLRDLL